MFDYKKDIERRLKTILQCYPSDERNLVTELIGRRILGIDNRAYPEFTYTELQAIAYEGIRKEGDFPKRIYLEGNERGKVGLSTWLFLMILNENERREFREMKENERTEMKKNVIYQLSPLVPLPPITYELEAYYDGSDVYSMKMHPEDFKMLHGDIDQFRDGKVSGVKVGKEGNREFVSLPFALIGITKEEVKEKVSVRIPPPPPPIKK